MRNVVFLIFGLNYKFFRADYLFFNDIYCILSGRNKGFSSAVLARQQLLGESSAVWLIQHCSVVIQHCLVRAVLYEPYSTVRGG